jgi:2,3-dihydroxy-2,3-dihydrophenylpropionate dehydrogenase
MTNPRSVLITGGASGIGAALAAEFCRLGDRVVVFDRQEPPAELSGQVEYVAGDVTDFGDNETAVARALDAFGGLDVFIGNAGIHDGGIGLDDAPGGELADLITQVFQVDVLGYVLGAKASVDALRSSNGSMIFTLSDAAFITQGNGAGLGYTAAKHGGLGVVRHLAATLAPRVRVNAVAPGGIVTNLRAASSGGPPVPVFTDPEAVEAAVRDLNPLGIVLTPPQIVGVYTFLASAGAAGMTGEVLRPDGGLSLR